MVPLIISSDSYQPSGVNNRVRGVLDRSASFSGVDTESD